MHFYSGKCVRNEHSFELNTGGPRYPRSFYLRIRLFTNEIWVKKVKLCFFICEFIIRGPN